MKERRKKSDKPAAERVGGLRAVGDMLPSVGGTAFRRFGFVQSSVVSRWREIVGPRYADVSAPESIRFPAGKHKDGVLTLMVDSAHAPMMQHVAPAIMERVNRFFGYGAVARLTIRQGQVTPPAPRMDDRHRDDIRQRHQHLVPFDGAHRERHRDPGVADHVVHDDHGRDRKPQQKRQARSDHAAGITMPGRDVRARRGRPRGRR